MIDGGAPAEGGFLAVHERDGRTAAILSVDRPRPFMRAGRELTCAAREVEPAVS